jgi:hypothetical protein
MAELAVMFRVVIGFLWMKTRRWGQEELPVVIRPPLARTPPTIDPKREAWRRAAERLGFEMSETDLTGTVWNYRVTVSRWLHRWGEIEITVDGRHTIPEELVISSLGEEVSSASR